ncbi:MAG TPA: alpha-glucan family phosphorylase [Bacteroidales bacterium]|nr:alpha-glucan family phosphorylase [Bacteroidales bacterium]HPS73554.1 alpha-glucan family phosphorylase [Bacteroidales bacterium]
MTDFEISLNAPDYLFETSWEVCNKVGGIYTVISTKALTLVNTFHDNYILIGPEVWKEEGTNPDFTEDKLLFRSWREKAESEGLRLRIGRWNIPGDPVTILVDFTPFFPVKDAILTKLWETYKLDSISGGWDYLEPALFGYVAGKVIESFYEFNLSGLDRIVAQFHEWMTGTGILYLKEHVPQAGTIFTTHATVLGRCIAGNGLPLYKDIAQYNGEVMARQFGVVSKYSLERLSAQESDCFTTVSRITDQECAQFLGKPVDVITPNGFEDSFIPDSEELENIRQDARAQILQVTRALLNQNIPNDAILLINSGRYEFHNKGIDLFIDAMGQLNQHKNLRHPVVAFLTIPANQTGPRKELLDRLKTTDFAHPIVGEYLTHGMHEPENDAILRRISGNNLHNSPLDNVKIVFVPAYLNGNDGIFNTTYYNLLAGFDASVFPSYYEPWGYTPLESLAFHVPAITTSLAGFGVWIEERALQIRGSAMVIKRSDDNDAQVVKEIVAAIARFTILTPDQRATGRLRANEISKSALWKNLGKHYFEAFSIAINQTQERAHFYFGKQPKGQEVLGLKKFDIKPKWKKVLVQQRIPENLQGLERLTKNLWWSWHYEGIELFEMINHDRWYELKFNPIALLESLTIRELRELSSNEAFIAKLNTVVGKFDAYMAKAAEKPADMVAYFSMEFGLHSSLKIYSGGLGLLAGDYLKEASDSNYNMIGIGLLYRYGYFQQELSVHGDQVATYSPQKFTHLPLLPVRDTDGNWMRVAFTFPGRTMYAKIWKVDVGRIPLYLLDTDFAENIESDRTITNQLYGGDWENRMKQELLLGIGGIRMINQLGLKPTLYHCNEGHAAFIGLERLKNLIQKKHLTFIQAVEVVRASTLFTTHTPVPAGHDTFTEDLMRRFLSHIPDYLEISWDQFMNLGRMVENDPNEKFSMSVFAAKLSQEVNGVSRIHGRVTREMFDKMYPGYFPEELPIGYVTNGVHLPTWTARSWQQLYEKTFGEGFIADQSNADCWKKIHEVDDALVWNIHLKQKNQLWEYIIDRAIKDTTRRHENPKPIFTIRDESNPAALTIGFARRFATYKRGDLLFTNLDRLSDIVNNRKKPVRFLFAGKAHPDDTAGQDLIRKIFTVSRMPQFLGKIIFVENYDIELAKYLVRGVDIWLNTPTRPLEASGTSGEKAALNGVLNFSVLDGWWAEGYKPGAGWALMEESIYDNAQFQDELDAETIYSLLEDEIVPLYYDVNSKKIPVKWVSYMKNSIADIAPHFTMKRQLDDYIRLYYNRMIERSLRLKADNYQIACDIAAWKRKILKGWDQIEVIKIKTPDSSRRPLDLGEPFKAEVVLNTYEIPPEEIGIEVIFGKKINDVVRHPEMIFEMKIAKTGKRGALYACEIEIDRAGVYDFVFRVFPKNSLLPHRQDFPLVKWI